MSKVQGTGEGMNKTTTNQAPKSGLKPVNEIYGDESDEEDCELEGLPHNNGSFMQKSEAGVGGFSLGLPLGMSKTFDISNPSGAKAVPKLDFRKLKQVKEQKDWYGYQEKLETNVKFLRQRIIELEDENKELNHKFKKVTDQNKTLFSINQKMSKSLKRGNQKLNEIKEKYSEINFEQMTLNFGHTYDLNEYIHTEDSAEKIGNDISENQSPAHIISDDRPASRA